jgi:tetratricopeptide (TPR) repeat protein
MESGERTIAALAVGLGMRSGCNNEVLADPKERMFGLRKMRKVLLAFLIVCLIETPALAKQLQPKRMMKIGDEIVDCESGKMFLNAQELLTSKQFEQAAVLFKQFLETYPDSASGHYKFGFVLLQQGKDSAALEQAKRCTELKPGFFGGWALLGEASTHLKLEAQAKQAYEKALAIQSSGENADIIREQLSDLERTAQTESFAVGEDQQVAEQNRKILTLNKALALCDQANDLGKQKQFGPGLQKCREALKIAPDSDKIKENVVGYLNNYAADCVEKQNFKQAEVLMKEAISFQFQAGGIASTRMTALKNYGALLKFLGRTDEAKLIEAQMKTVGASQSTR